MDPISKFGPDQGAALDPEELETYLREIQAFMFRRKGAYAPPPLGRVALAGFSNGCGQLLNKLVANSQHPLLKDFVKEIYLLDPRMNSEQLVGRLLKWRGDNAADKRIRVYLSKPDASYLKVIDTATMPSTESSAIALIVCTCDVAAESTNAPSRVPPGTAMNRKCDGLHDLTPPPATKHAAPSSTSARYSQG